jgi:hypothetical protein
MKLFTFYCILTIIGFNISAQLEQENSIINLINEDELYLSKFVLSFLLQSIIIIVIYDFHLVEYMRIMYFVFVLILIATVIPFFFYNFINIFILTDNVVEINILDLLIELKNITL